MFVNDANFLPASLLKDAQCNPNDEKYWPTEFDLRHKEIICIIWNDRCFFIAQSWVRTLLLGGILKSRKQNEKEIGSRSICRLAVSWHTHFTICTWLGLDKSIEMCRVRGWGGCSVSMLLHQSGGSCNEVGVSCRPADHPFSSGGEGGGGGGKNILECCRREGLEAV